MEIEYKDDLYMMEDQSTSSADSIALMLWILVLFISIYLDNI